MRTPLNESPALLVILAVMTAKSQFQHQDVEKRSSGPLVLYVVQHANNDSWSS
jgi:hypothetical protein